MEKIFILTYVLLFTLILTPFILSMNNISQKSKIAESDNRLNGVTFDVQKIEDKDEIPRHIFQCYKTREGVPDKIIENIKKLNPNWEYHFYDDKMCIDFLQTHYGKDYVDKFNSIESGAHKADLWRYCVLYMYGGVYVDIDLEMLVSFDAIIDNETFIVPYTDTITTRIVNANNIYNALIMTKPKHPIIYDCIQRIMRTSIEHMKHDYLVNVRRMKYSVKNFLKTKKLKCQNYIDEKTKILHEYWAKLPYTFCVYDYALNKKIANSKYENYVYEGDSGVFT